MNVAEVRRNDSKLHPRTHLSRRVQDYVTIFLFLAPSFILFLVFLVYPVIQSVHYSLFNWNGLGPAVHFIGLDNFKQS